MGREAAKPKAPVVQPAPIESGSEEHDRTAVTPWAHSAAALRGSVREIMATAGVAVNLPGVYVPTSWSRELGCAHNLNADKWLVTFDPGVMAWWDRVGVSSTNGLFGAIVHPDPDLTRHGVTGVIDLAALGPDHRSDALGPAPARGQGEATHRDIIKVHHVDLGFLRRATFIRGVKRLACQRRYAHRGAHDVLLVLHDWYRCVLMLTAGDTFRKSTAEADAATLVLVGIDNFAIVPFGVGI
jgi:hypothetical protein